jgi:hypothetical protein
MEREMFDTQQWILNSRQPENVVMLADMYIEMQSREPTLFRLPVEHRNLLPVITKYHDDPKGFVDFVRELRDLASKDAYKGLNELFRRVQSRFVQQERRRRLNLGVSLIENEVGVQFTFGQKQSVAMWLEQFWGKERTSRLEDARRAHSKGRLSSDERAEICDEFWAGIDEQLANDIVPIPPEIVYAKLTSLESYKPNSVRNVS